MSYFTTSSRHRARVPRALASLSRLLGGATRDVTDHAAAVWRLPLVQRHAACARWLVAVQAAAGFLVVLAAGAEGPGLAGVAVGQGIAALALAALAWRPRPPAAGPGPGRAAAARGLRRLAAAASLGAVFSATVLLAVLPAGDAPLSAWVLPLVALQMAMGAGLLAAMPAQAVSYLTATAPALALALVHVCGVPVVVAAGVAIAAMLALCVVARQAGVALDARQRQAFRLDRQHNLIDLLTARRGGRAHDILWLTDLHGRLVDVCSGGGLLVQRPDPAGAVEGLVVGRLLDDVLASLCPQDAAAQGLHACFRQSVQQGRPVQDLQLPVRTAGAGTSPDRWWSANARPWADRAGTPQGWIGVFSDVTDARTAQGALRQRADFDNLTGLANRACLTAWLDAALRTAGSGQAVAVMLIDLDHFKAVNDTRGHAAGDAVLAAVGRRLRACLRAEDLAARLGGDEFALVLPGMSDPDQLRALADRLIAQISMPCPHEGGLLRVGATIGIAVAPLHGQTPPEVLQSADLALYAAKAAGRGQSALFDHLIEARHRRSAQLVRAVSDAIAEDRLEIVWQARLAAQRMAVVDVKAAPSLHHATVGAVTLDELLAAAEEGGHTPALWRWLVSAACRQATALPRDCTVTLGLPHRPARLPDLSGMVQAAAQAAGLDLRRVQVEVEGNHAAQCDADDWQALDGLQALGVRVALGGFGVGQGSLALLRQHRFDQLQLHGLLLQVRGAPETTLVVLRGLVALARSLGMSTLATGVDSPAQLELARAAGCDVLEAGPATPPLPLQDLLRRMAHLPGATMLADGRTLAVVEDLVRARPPELHAVGRAAVD